MLILCGLNSFQATVKMEAFVNSHQLPGNLGVWCTCSSITADLWHHTHASKYGSSLKDVQTSTNVAFSQMEQSDWWLHNDHAQLLVQPVAKTLKEEEDIATPGKKSQKTETSSPMGSQQKLLLFTLSCFCVVFVPPADSKGLSNPSEVEALREKVYASLEAYCKQKYPEQPGRYADHWNRARPQTLVFRQQRATHT